MQDTSTPRLDLAKKLGATKVFDTSSPEEFKIQVLGATDNRGVGCWVDVNGSDLALGFALVRWVGRMC